MNGHDAFVVAQLGARMHYAVPRILHEAGQLERLLTDSCVSRYPFRLLDLLPQSLRRGGLRRLLDRKPAGIPPKLIRANNILGYQYARDFARTTSESDRVRLFLRVNDAFGRWASSQDWGAARALFVYNAAGLNILMHAKQRGLRGVLEQTIAPYAVERRLVAEERSRCPNWEPPDTGGSEFNDYAANEKHEWQLADLLLCASDFVRKGMIAEGAPADRIVVVPYGVDSRFSAPPPTPHGGPLRVLTVGTVGLRKGPMYAVEAARRLRGRAEFRWVGAFKMNPAANTELGEDVDFVGSIPRSDIPAQFAWADVFLLPSLCEGSATATYEALTAGRPVICTPNCGSVVRDGIEGFIVPVRDVDAIVERIERLATNAEMRRSMAEAAQRRAAEMNYEAYGRNLLSALNSPSRL